MHIKTSWIGLLQLKTSVSQVSSAFYAYFFNEEMIPLQQAACFEFFTRPPPQ